MFFIIWAAFVQRRSLPWWENGSGITGSSVRTVLLKNRTYEYLIQNKINENHQIIWMVSDKKKCEKLKCKNVKFVTAENKYGWSSPLAYYYGAVAGFFFYTNNTAYLNFYHCKGQITVNMWHGCGYKDVAKDNKPPAGKSMMHFDHAMVPGPVFVIEKC